MAFTDYSEGRDPETVRETLTRYHRASREVIERHGGRVEKFIGDAVMAVWGAPRANEDDPERAVRAALEVIHAIDSLEEGLQARVAVLTGQAAVTLGATDEGMVAGDLVNTAARLQSIAQPNSVLVGEATMQASSSAIVFEPVGEHQLKGKTAPVPAWRALRVVSEVGGRSRGEGIEPPFVGRDLELRLLKDVLHQTGLERRPRLVSVTGPAGIGKSRLTWELHKYVDGLVEDTYWHFGRSPSYGEGVTFWALGEMVRRRAGLAETDDEATTRVAIGETVAAYVPESDRTLVASALLALLGLEPAPPGGRDMLFAAWRIFFESIASRGTAVLIFEDIQWADAGQLDFIEHLMEWSRGVPLLVITLARPELLEDRPGWGTVARSFNAVGLEPLTDANMRELLLGLVPALPDDAIGQIQRRADGIPLYAVETVRMLAADGRLRATGSGAFEPANDLGELAVPDTLRALVGSRLDALDSADRSLLQNAAVLGKTFEPAALASIAELDETEVESRLRSLARGEVLEVSVDPRSPERGQYSFVQSVIQEVAYDTLSRHDRRSRHLAAARYMEQHEDDEVAGILSTHYRAAYEATDPGPEADALRVQARLALRGAAGRALSLGSGGQALEYLRAALEITDDPAERGPLLELSAHAADVDSQPDPAVGLGRDAVAAFLEAGDEASADRSFVQLSQIMIEAGHAEDLLEQLPEVIERVRARGDEEAQAGLLANLARALYRMGHAEDAVQRADEALAIAEPLGLERLIAEALLNKGSALVSTRRIVEPRILMQASVDMARQVGDVTTELRAMSNLAVTMLIDDIQGAFEAYRQVLAKAERLGVGTMAEWAVSSMSWVNLEIGDDWDEALAYSRTALATELRTDSAKGLEYGSIELVQILRGEDERAAHDERERLLANAEGAEFKDWHSFLPGWKALVNGAYRDAYAAFETALGLLAQRQFEARNGMVFAAHWARDRDLAAAALEEARRQQFIGRSYRGIEAMARGGLAVLTGDPIGGRDQFVEAIGHIRPTGRAWLLALTQLDALFVLPDDPTIAAWEPEVRARLERLGAKPVLARLDEAVSARQLVAERS